MSLDTYRERQYQARVARAKVVVALLVVALAVIGFIVWRQHQADQAREDRINGYFCDMMYEYGSPSWERCMD